MSRVTVKDYLCALLSKSFIILSGGSGTGKTRMALQVAEKLGEAQVENRRIRLTVDMNGLIQNYSEDEIVNMCQGSNHFMGVIGEQTVPIDIVMASLVEIKNPQMLDLFSRSIRTEIDVIASQRSFHDLYELIPVGADWTDARQLLGYVNPFGGEGRKTYEITQALRLLLRAAHPERRSLPHFLILDEMNLSYVERYFSPFLSIMESNKLTTREGIPLLTAEEIGLVAEKLQANGDLQLQDTTRENINRKLEAQSAEELARQTLSLSLPPNVFIIGTINVDETTYMFSPKVLDRAHVLEVKSERPRSYLAAERPPMVEVPDKDEIMSLFAQNIAERSAANVTRIRSFDRLIEVAKEHERATDVSNQLITLLDGLYLLLEPIGFDFGYRTVNEVVEYVIVSLRMNIEDELSSVMDRAVLQKVLPKIHGNRRQLSDVLKAVQGFLIGEEASYQWGAEIVRAMGTGLHLVMSAQKIERMRRSLEHTGYASFIS